MKEKEEIDNLIKKAYYSGYRNGILKEGLIAKTDFEYFPETKVSFTGTGIWLIGYLLFVWLTPAQFNLAIFLIPLIVIAAIEGIESCLKIWGAKR